jgi:hypothetical protein
MDMTLKYNAANIRQKTNHAPELWTPVVVHQKEHYIHYNLGSSRM